MQPHLKTLSLVAEGRTVTDEELKRIVAGHDQDLYRGDRNAPGLTIRMALAEERIESVQKDVNEIKDDTKATKRWAIVTLIGIVVQIFLWVVMRK